MNDCPQTIYNLLSVPLELHSVMKFENEPAQFKIIFGIEDFSFGLILIF